MGGAPGKPLGDGTMLLKDLDGTPKTKAIRLINPANGKMEGGEVRTCVRPVHMFASHRRS